jgi:hypothetical protein
MKAQELYNDKTRNAIIKDLLRKTPKAALGHDNVGLTHETDYEFCNRYNKYRDLYICNKQFWGYTPQQMIMCGLWSDDGVRSAICAEAEAAGKVLSYKAIKRRANRIEDRIGRYLSREIRKGETPGIYRVNRSYDTIGAVAADSLVHAEQLATVTYGALFNDSRYAPRITWVGPVSRALLLEEVQQAQRGNFDARIERARNQYDKALAEIEREREEQSFIALIGLNMAETIEESA